MLLTDRSKDLIKSGGEWISSIELENIAVGHPDVAEAAAIAAPDEKWGERPLLIVVPRAGHEPQGRRSVRAFFKGKVANFAVPDRVIVAGEIPHGATGKILKSRTAAALHRRQIMASPRGEAGRKKDTEPGKLRESRRKAWQSRFDRS